LLVARVKSWPLAEHHAGAWEGFEHAVLLSDLLTPTQLRRNPWYLDVMRPRGEKYVLKMWLPSPVGISRGIWFKRAPDCHDFDDRDRAVLTVLRPHLAAVRQRWGRNQRPLLLLTLRETEILKLVRDGLTNREIAARLFISPGTVRSHLENIFEKLNVHTRTAALACAFGANSYRSSR
jgi:DNA-binding CsgD family transcriptional regulator